MRKTIGLMVILTLSGTAMVSAEKMQAASEVYKIDGKEIELARYAKAYIGKGNVTVEIAPYKQGSEEGAILLFHGIESEWDDKAINHQVEPQGYGRKNYVTQYDGKRFTTLIGRPDNKDILQYELYVPGVRDGIALAPSDGAAQMTNPRKIFQEYQKQQKKN